MQTDVLFVLGFHQIPPATHEQTYEWRKAIDAALQAVCDKYGRDMYYSLQFIESRGVFDGTDTSFVSHPVFHHSV